MAEEKGKELWRYTVVSGKDHPDHNPPVTIVSEASDEAVEKEEAAVNAEREKRYAVVAIVAKTPAAKPAEENLEGKTVAELKDLAEERGIDIPWDARKDEIIKAIKKGK